MTLFIKSEANWESATKAPADASDVTVSNLKRLLQDLRRDVGLGSESSQGRELGARVLAIEARHGHRRVLGVVVVHKMEQPLGEDERLAASNLLGEDAVRRVDEAHHDVAAEADGDLGGAWVGVERDDALGLEVDAGQGQAQRVEPR